VSGIFGGGGDTDDDGEIESDSSWPVTMFHRVKGFLGGGGGNNK
jgi:hypothetical protein